MPDAPRALPPAFATTLQRALDRRALARYRRGLDGAFTRGHDLHKWDVIRRALADPDLLRRLRKGGPLPLGYGVGVGERAVELPWVRAHLPDPAPTRLLDAGSALNHATVMDALPVDDVDMHVVTLAPEAECHWWRGVSYLYHDLRDLPVRDNYYDTVACVSTLEHVGADNAAYTGRDADRERDARAHRVVMRELARVLAPGGTLLLTVPYGRPEEHGWFRQFDAARLQDAVDAFGPAIDVTRAFYRYTPEGWTTASGGACADCAYATRDGPRPEDGAVAARAVACVHIVKEL